VKIRHTTADDVPRILQLARESPSAAQWSVHQYHDLFRSDPQAVRLAIIAVETGEETPERVDQSNALGFLVARHLTPEWELENIVVARASRQKGIGKQLLERLLTVARETNSESVFLEVRESNSPARALYERSGFHETGRRKSYYSNPLEDAIIYRLTLL
jgi:[ribosomal protein S18]-alanine N-acetyltransferase